VIDTPLARRLRELIELNGPLTVADYMAHCLTDPQHGYYTTRDPIGASGDFTTAPEISQIFGEIIGAWLIHAWRLLGAPARVSLVELGPGRGTLMADILRVAPFADDFRRAISISLVETSPILRARQAASLGGYTPGWRDSLLDVPEGPLLVIANEFFDALPIRQFVRQDGSWRERMVGWRSGQLAYGLGPGELPQGPSAPEGAILEISPAREALAAQIAGRIVRHGGAALIFDYGHAGTAPGETLQAVRGHAFADPLDAPGETDLTAHVDFAALARAASAAGARVHGPIGQGEFLLSHGLAERSARLAVKADSAGRAALQAAVERLSAPTAMGTLFKVLALTRPEVSVPLLRA
jgi:NADH dehydrogenase [ubiquinone] 1 alpha subcomplex assembly factor 7